MAFKDILVPIDFSDSSLQALRLAIKLARQGNGRITLLHVGVIPAASYTEMATYGVVPPDTLIKLHEQMSVEQRHVVERIAREEIPEEVPWAIQLREGFPPEEIVSVAQEGNHDLLVMGTHGRTGMKRVLLGSVTERVLRTCPIPVLVTR